MRSSNDMTTGKPWQQILIFTLPMLLGNIAQQLYNTVDSIVVGQYIGDDALAAVRFGANPELTTRQKHRRECYVVAAEGADLARIEQEIKTMPNYFADYDTTVTFISAEEMKRDHAGIPHGGFVIRTGATGKENEHKHTIEYSLKLDSNPEFTASVLVAYARAVYKAANRGEAGCKTVFDIPPADLSPLSGEELRATML